MRTSHHFFVPFDAIAQLKSATYELENHMTIYTRPDSTSQAVLKTLFGDLRV
jgi:hypothetical protein